MLGILADHHNATVPADIDPRRITLTPGKKYPIHSWHGDDAFRIISDNDVDIFCLAKGCSHLNDRDWLLTTEPDVTAALLAALEAAVECGMVPASSAAEGGATKFSRQVQVADMIRAAIRAARGEG